MRDCLRAAYRCEVGFSCVPSHKGFVLEWPQRQTAIVSLTWYRFLRRQRIQDPVTVRPRAPQARPGIKLRAHPIAAAVPLAVGLGDIRSRA
jgi:hypothetical protein